MPPGPSINLTRPPANIMTNVAARSPPVDPKIVSMLPGQYQPHHAQNRKQHRSPKKLTLQ
jgi:hypothetical protein